MLRRTTFHTVQGGREAGTWPGDKPASDLVTVLRCYGDVLLNPSNESTASIDVWPLPGEAGSSHAARTLPRSTDAAAALSPTASFPAGGCRAGAALYERTGWQRGARNAAPLRQVAAQGGPPHPAHARSCVGPAAVAPAPRAPWAAVWAPESAFARRRLLAPRSAPGSGRLWSRVPRSPTSSCCSCRSRRFGRGRPRGEPPPAGP